MKKQKIANLIELKQNLVEGQYSFGVEGQLNISLPRHDGESHNQLLARTQAVAVALGKAVDDPEKIKASKGRIVIHNPNQNMPFILASSNIPVEWESLAKGVEVTKVAGNNMEIGTTILAHLNSENSEALHEVCFARPETHTGKLALERVLEASGSRNLGRTI